MGAQLFFKRSLGTIRVMVDGVERSLHVAHGDPIPDTITSESLARMKDLGAVGEKARVTRVDDLTQTGTDTAEIHLQLAAREAPASPSAATARTRTPRTSSTPTADLTGLAGMAGSDLVDLMEKARAKQVTGVSVKALLAAVGDSKEVAQKVLDAEKQVTKGDVRKELAKGLERVLGATS